MRPRAPLASLFQGPSDAIESAMEIVSLLVEADELSSDVLVDAEPAVVSAAYKSPPIPPIKPKTHRR